MGSLSHTAPPFPVPPPPLAAGAAPRLRVADECWVALARLHREHPDRRSFSASEILQRLRREAHGPVRAGVPVHVYLHNVANLPPNSARYRMFYRLDDGTYRLFRPGDTFHPARGGRTAPHPAGLPEQYHDLLAWYERDYCGQPGGASSSDDPVLLMLGVGQELWAEESGDAFVARERRAWEESPALPGSVASLEERVWSRLVEHQGETFRTVRDLPFQHQLEGNGIWIFREGKRINQRLSRGDVEKAIARCPLEKVTEVSDCRNPSYLFGLLTDRRIRGEDW